MLNWIYENIEWFFSGLGISMLTLVFGVAKKQVGFKLTFHFYMLLFVGIVFDFGADYFFNFSGDWRLRIFIFGLVILATFIIGKFISHIKQMHKVRKAVSRLTTKDCDYVLNCYQHDEYFYFELNGDYFKFEAKWENVLHVPRGTRVIINEPYKTCVYEYAYKLAKKRINKNT